MRRWELAGLAVVLLVAALLRFVDLPTRGTWDADQGTDMLVLWRIVHDGAWPLLGPSTSIGDFHHGVLYYYLLAPVAFLSGADPLAVAGFIALCGVAAVAVVWWLARSVAGPVAALVAAGLMAVSTSAIEESTFIWNPNFIPLSSAVSLAAAWRAWTTGRAAWWVVAAAGQAVTMHCHVLGAVMLVPLAALFVADVRRRHPGGERRAAVLAGVAGVALIGLSYLPLVVHELQSGFSETRGAADFFLAGSDRDGAPLATRLVIVPLRVLSWPLTGLITDQPLAGILAALLVVTIVLWRARRGDGAHHPERTAARWFGFALAWSALSLAVAASGLGAVVPGLPNDHYHSFLDPVVFTVAGMGAAGLWRRRTMGRLSAALPIAATIGVAALVALNVTIRPPAVAPDGGYPAAHAAAVRILDTVEGEPYVLQGLPTIKNANAYEFPLRRLGGRRADASEVGAHDLVVVCDRLLERIVGDRCGGPAEDRFASQLADDPTLVERFEASPRTSVSIYR